MNPFRFDACAGLDAVRESYLANGVVVIRDLIDAERLARFRKTALKVVCARASSAGIELPSGLDLDDAFNRMCAVNRSLGGNVYDCLRNHPEAIKLIPDRLIVRYIESLLNTRDIYYAIDQIHFRIDRRSEERFSLPWHQDYWWNNTTKNAVTMWLPLTDVPQELGPMRFLLGSHNEVAKIRVNPHFKVRWDQNRLFEIAEPVRDELGVDISVAAGDVVFLHALVLHRSGINSSGRNRWTFLMRYADMFDPTFVAKGWRSGIRVGHLSILDTDPECVVNRSEIIEPEAASATA